jgi:truncated hemoglobin YjbI
LPEECQDALQYSVLFRPLGEEISERTEKSLWCVFSRGLDENPPNGVFFHDYWGNPKLGVDSREARRIRRETLGLHLKLAASQADLRRRVTALIKPFNGDLDFVDTATDDLIEAGDGRHLFYEQLKHIHFALRAINPEDLDDAMLEEILDWADRLAGLLGRIKATKKKCKS